MQTTICPWKLLCGGTCTGPASSGCTSADPKAPKPFVLAQLWPGSLEWPKPPSQCVRGPPNSPLPSPSLQMTLRGGCVTVTEACVGYPMLSAHPRKLPSGSETETPTSAKDKWTARWICFKTEDKKITLPRCDLASKGQATSDLSISKTAGGPE